MMATALLLAAGIAAAACGGGGSKQAATTGAGTPVSTARAASHDGWATPITLPVTPVASQFTVKDPKLEALPGARVITGTYDGGGYQIELPYAWNGDVVYFAHGFRGNGPDLTISQPPLREYLVQHGYAWAASSYSQNGYHPGTGARDTLALRDVFAQQVGEPKRGYLYGQSMGGNVVTVSLETYPTAYDGAVAECGSLSGQGIVDYIFSWGALGGYFSGVDVTAQTTDYGKLGDSLKNKVVPALGSPANLTPKGQGFASAIQHLTGGPRPYFREGFGANYFFNFVLLVNAVAVPGAANAVAQNADTQYAVSDGLSVSSDQLNREIARVQANPVYQDRATYPEFGAPTGKIQRPLLTLHGTGDLFVPISMEQIYRRAVDAAGAGDLLVQRAVRRGGHCAFTETERERAFEDMVTWVRQGQKPAGEDLLGDLTDAGRAFTSPLGDDDPGGIAP
jgi:pimeloyl-ACP methyl ester carboxylesterase